ncbi:hypothetical protein [Kitasatospora sp. NPDC085464]|uniref:hypothetical protein n=1 Tax=Kitasatospora sp. NPDC085464 TaxID=3364063 RepID=UPI0037CC430A
MGTTRVGGLALTILLLSFGALLPIWSDKEFAPSSKAIGSLLVIGFCLLVIVGRTPRWGGRAAGHRSR